MKAYYQLSGEEVLREVNGSEEPLTKEQVSENQKKYGPNELTEGKKKIFIRTADESGLWVTKEE